MPLIIRVLMERDRKKKKFQTVVLNACRQPGEEEVGAAEEKLQ